MKQIQQSNRGFTIVEVLFAVSILLVVLAGVLPMYIQTLRATYVATSKLDVNNEMRRTNNQIISEAREADAFVLYDNFRGAWIDGSFVDFRQQTYSGKGRLKDGQTGKFLLFLYYEVDDNPYDSDLPNLERMFGMYLDASEAETVGKVKMFIKDDIDTSLTLEENIPPISSSSDHNVLIDEMTGLIDGDIFYNFGGTSVVVNGKIARDNGAVKETNTYNFTITPR